jgi:hypothetical protein
MTRCGLHSFGSEGGISDGFFEFGNEPLGSTKGEEFFDKLGDQ